MTKSLKVNLVEAAGEVNDEGRPVGPGHHAAHETFGQPPVQQVRRSCVQPVLVQSEVRCDRSPCGQEWLRQWLGEAQFAVVGYREEIHIPGRTPDQAECRQSGTADDHDLKVAAQHLQLIVQRPEQQADRRISDLHILERIRSR